MTITNKPAWVAFVFGAVLGVEITGLALGRDDIAFVSMLTGALLGTAAIAYVMYGGYRDFAAWRKRDATNE